MHDNLVSQLNSEQKQIYDVVLQSVYERTGQCFFVYGYGGTGKTFLWNAIISRLRSEKLIVLAVASSGVAALLLPGLFQVLNGLLCLVGDSFRFVFVMQ